MSKFTVYFDASGNEHSSVITVAGFVSRLKRWERFETEWRALLPRRIPIFHMTDFASSKAGWESWQGKSERRLAFFNKLVGCIQRNTNKGFGISLRLVDYRTFDSKFQLKESSGGPYSLACQAFLAEVKKWADRNRIDYVKDISYVCEDGDKGKGAMMLRARHDGFNVAPQAKVQIRAFDACDLVGWKMRRLVDDALIKELHLEDEYYGQQFQKTLQQFGTILQLNAMIDAAVLEAACATIGIPARELSEGQTWKRVAGAEPPQEESKAKRRRRGDGARLG